MKAQLTTLDPDRASALLEETVAALDVSALARTYRDDGEFLFIERLLPDALIRALADEAGSLRPLAVRNRIPFYRSAGTVVDTIVQQRAPLLAATLRSPALLGLLDGLGSSLRPDVSRSREPSVNLYYYDVVGDWMKDHRDACPECDVGSQTLVLGIVERSTQRLRCRVRGGERLYRTVPGSLVIFNTTRTRHGVTPLGPGEQRVVACASYSMTSRSAIDRALSVMQESIVYYSPRDILRAIRDRRRQESQ